MSDDESETGFAAPEARVGLPRWVQAFLITAAAVVVLGVVLMVITGGQHGPGRHRADAPSTSTVPAPTEAHPGSLR